MDQSVSISTLGKSKAKDFGQRLRDEIHIHKNPGYIYAYPPKCTWEPIRDANQFVKDAWSDFLGGELGVYLHVPFCPPRFPPRSLSREVKDSIEGGMDRKCGYCNLFAIPLVKGKGMLDDYVEDLQRELHLYEEIFRSKGPRISSIYFGGGTPSLLALSHYDSIFESLGDLFDIPTDIEISLEASPETLTGEYLSDLVGLGFNRISLGVQTLDKGELCYIGRSYDPDLGLEAVRSAKSAGFSNVNVDLIVGLPGQDEPSFANSLGNVLVERPETVTHYPHLIRPITRFGQEAEIRRQLASKGVDSFDRKENGFLEAMCALSTELLLGEGYLQESPTRWVLPRKGGYKQQEHEFNQVPCLGIGPSSRSYSPSRHYSTDYAVCCEGVESILDNWSHRLQNNEFPVTSGIVLNSDELKRRYVIFKLMTIPGLDRDEYADRFVSPLCEDFGPQLVALEDQGLLLKEKNRFRFTPAGLEHSSAISRICFYSEEMIHREERYSHK